MGVRDVERVLRRLIGSKYIGEHDGRVLVRLKVRVGHNIEREDHTIAILVRLDLVDRQRRECDAHDAILLSGRDGEIA